MPNTTTQPQPDLFTSLVNRFGLTMALQLLPFFTDSSNTQKSVGAARLGATGLEAGSAVSPSFGSVVSPVLPYLGPGLGLASLGLGANQLAGSMPVPERGVAAGQLGVQALPAISGAATSGLGGLAGGLTTGGLGSLGGYGGGKLSGLAFGKSREQGLGSGAGAGLGALIGTLLFPGVGTLLGGLLGGFGGGGIGSLFMPHPTKGTQFRTGMQDIFKQLGLPSFNRADPNIYNMTPDKLKTFSPEAQATAEKLAQLIAPFAPKYDKGAAPYTTQTFNILLNTLGNDITKTGQPIIDQLLKQGIQAKNPYTPPPATTRSPVTLPPSITPFIPKFVL